MPSRRLFLAAASATAATLALPRFSHSQSDPVRLLVGFAPGGAVDVVARILADAMRPFLGHPVIVENRSGAGGVIALQAASKAQPDGRTLVMTPGSMLTLQPYVDQGLQIDPMRDLTPVATACDYHFALAVNAGLGVRTLREFLDWCQQHPDQASFGSPGTGTTPHLLGELLARASGAPLVHVPYRGGGQAVVDLLGGQLPAMMTTVPAVLSHHRKGTLRLLATSAAQSPESLAEVPTFAASGFPSLTVEDWFGLAAPAATPLTTVERLAVAVRQALETAKVKSAIERPGYLPRWRSPQDLTETVRKEGERWRVIVEQLGLRARS